MSRVETEMKVDSVSGVITASYPWKNCVRRMLDNRRQAQRVQEQMEKHMVEVGTHPSYVAEMKKSIEEGKVRKLTEQEMDDWHGPRHYITTFAVVKPESVSTKTCVVANSAMCNVRSRLSLNDCMWAGPNALCDLLDCLLFWRAVEVALMTDLKKAYQAIHTGDMELHLRRFLFRAATKDPWEDYAFTRATFGDLAAGLILEVVKRHVAELGQKIDPMAALQLQLYSYMDDSLMGGSREDAERMRGQRVDGEYSGTVPQILAHGAMKVKFMAISGTDDPWEAEQLAGKTLGVQYRLATDEIFFQIRPGFYVSKARSSDQVRDWMLLDGNQVEMMAKGLSPVHQTKPGRGCSSPGRIWRRVSTRTMCLPLRGLDRSRRMQPPSSTNRQVQSVTTSRYHYPSRRAAGSCRATSSNLNGDRHDSLPLPKYLHIYGTALVPGTSLPTVFNCQ